MIVATQLSTKDQWCAPCSTDQAIFQVPIGFTCLNSPISGSVFLCSFSYHWIFLQSRLESLKYLLLRFFGFILLRSKGLSCLYRPCKTIFFGQFVGLDFKSRDLLFGKKVNLLCVHLEGCGLRILGGLCCERCRRQGQGIAALASEGLLARCHCLHHHYTGWREGLNCCLLRFWFLLGTTIPSPDSLFTLGN